MGAHNPDCCLSRKGEPFAMPVVGDPNGRE
jgi:hypothetical protein